MFADLCGGLNETWILSSIYTPIELVTVEWLSETLTWHLYTLLCNFVCVVLVVDVCHHASQQSKSCMRVLQHEDTVLPTGHLAISYSCMHSHRCHGICRDAQPMDMQLLADHLANSYIPNTVIIDATASELPPAQYLRWMQKGIHIITPNKKLGSGPLDQYLALRHFQRESYIHFFYEVRIHKEFCMCNVSNICFSCEVWNRCGLVNKPARRLQV